MKTAILIYLAGFMISMIWMHVQNRKEKELGNKASINNAIIFSLLSWVGVLIFVLAALVRVGLFQRLNLWYMGDVDMDS